MKFRILHHDDQERLIEELKARFEDPTICFEKTEGLSENNLSQINMELEEEAWRFISQRGHLLDDIRNVSEYIVEIQVIES